MWEKKNAEKVKEEEEGSSYSVNENWIGIIIKIYIQQLNKAENRYVLKKWIIRNKKLNNHDHHDVAGYQHWLIFKRWQCSSIEEWASSEA